jgi:ubiquinone/menaquinone biosynthesis C-methylase UbiE
MKDLKAIYNSTKSVYEKYAAEFDNTRSKSLFEKRWLDRFVDHLIPEAKVLDVGCGSGEPIAKYLISRALDITGVDYSQGMLDLAQRRFPNSEWICCDMRNIQLDKFDGIIAWNSFFHLNQDDQRCVLELFSKHLNPGGTLIFTAGPSSGEVTGQVNGRDVYHSSLSYDEYKSELDRLNIEILDCKLNDLECNGHSIYLSKKKSI